jgi:K+-sensing histidine kinase KdpD
MLSYLPREAPRLSARRQEVNLLTLWRELTAAVAEQAVSKGIEIDLRMQEDEVLEADPARLARVFRNLLSAAVNLSARDTCVAIRARIEAADLVLQLETESGARLPVRLHRLSTRVPSEAGFALHAARELVRERGGSVDARFLENFGVDFVLRMPTEAPQFF